MSRVWSCQEHWGAYHGAANSRCKTVTWVCFSISETLLWQKDLSLTASSLCLNSGNKNQETPNGLLWWSRLYRTWLQCGRPGFYPWIRKIPWRRKQQPTPVFLSGESHGQRSLVGYSPWGHKESDRMEQLSLSLSFNSKWNLAETMQVCLKKKKKKTPLINKMPWEIRLPKKKVFSD